MSDMNRLNVVGRLTKDPELKYTSSGSAFCNFSIACNRTWKQDGEKKEKVSFFNCTCWGKQSEVIAEYCKKGHRIGIDGRIEQRSWESDGKKNYTVDIIVDNFQFLESKNDNQ